MTISDFHTHHHRPGAIIDIDPTVTPAIPLVDTYFYSAGIHPWRALMADRAALAELDRLAALPAVIAIGETGLDTMRAPAPPLRLQLQLLNHHIELSEGLAKPLILHIVKQFHEIIRLKAALKPAQPWIIHGFRGKPQLAAQLISHGFYLSYGQRFNPASVAVTPPERLLVETDESDLPIGRIAELVGAATPLQAMKQIALKSPQFGALYGRAPEDA